MYISACTWACSGLPRVQCLLLQVVKVLVLAVYTTVSGYVQPYRSQLANLLETAVHINFLFLLILNATSYFHNDLFIFSSDSLTDGSSSESCTGGLAGIAHVTWILMPVYYLPVIGACVTATVLAVLFIRYRLEAPGGLRNWDKNYVAYNSILLTLYAYSCTRYWHVMCTPTHPHTILRKWYLQNQSPDDTDSIDEYSDYRRVVSSSDHQSWTIDLPDDIDEGFLELHQTGKPRKRELSRRGRRSSNRTSFFNRLSRPSFNIT